MEAEGGNCDSDSDNKAGMSYDDFVEKIVSTTVAQNLAGILLLLQRSCRIFDFSGDLWVSEWNTSLWDM